MKRLWIWTRMPLIIVLGLICATHAQNFQSNDNNASVPPNEGHIIDITTYTLFAIASFFVVTRIFSRLPWLRGAGLGWDDATVLISLVCAAAMTVVAYFQLQHGLGRDSLSVSQVDLRRLFLWSYISQPLYVAITFTAKLSLVLLYLRIFNNPERKRSIFRIICYVVATSFVLAAIALILVSIFQCQPISYAWRQNIPGASGSCINHRILDYAISSLNIASNLAVILLPIPQFFMGETTEKAPPHKKFGRLIFLLSSLAVLAISILRLTKVSSLNGTTLFRDPTDALAPLSLWTLIESYSTLIFTNIPTFLSTLHTLFTLTSHSTSWIRLSLSSRSTPTLLTGDDRPSSSTPTFWRRRLKTPNPHSPSPQLIRRSTANGKRLGDTLNRIEKASGEGRKTDSVPTLPEMAVLRESQVLDLRESVREGLREKWDWLDLEKADGDEWGRTGGRKWEERGSYLTV